MNTYHIRQYILKYSPILGLLGLSLSCLLIFNLYKQFLATEASVSAYFSFAYLAFMLFYIPINVSNYICATYEETTSKQNNA